jgi:TonB family protein
MRSRVILVALPFLLTACATGSGREEGTSTGFSRETPSFTPVTVEPRLLNQADVQQAVVREYPSTLREAGIGGTVEVWVLIDATGKVVNTSLNKGSGSPQLNEAALRVGALMVFTPAQNGDQYVPAWISVPVTFRT